MRRSILWSTFVAPMLVVGAARAQDPLPAVPAERPCTPSVADPCAAPRAPIAVAAPASADRRPDGQPRKKEDTLVDARLLHGFRIGYGYIMNTEQKLEGLGGESIKEKTGMRSPHHFLIGYEAFYRMVGHSWLNVILVGNALLSGIEQSKIYPVGNLLIGFEFNNSFQVGAGASFTPLKGQEAHTIFAAGWTPRVGSFYVPVHAFFIPDVDGAHRMGVTTGVTF